MLNVLWCRGGLWCRITTSTHNGNKCFQKGSGADKLAAARIGARWMGVVITTTLYTYNTYAHKKPYQLLILIQRKGHRVGFQITINKAGWCCASNYPDVWFSYLSVTRRSISGYYNKNYCYSFFF